MSLHRMVSPMMTREGNPAGKLLMRVMRWTLTLAMIVLLSMAVTWLRGPEAVSETSKLSLRMLNQGSLSLEALRGRPVVLNFWATWCGPCRLEVPALSRFAARHPEVVVIGVVAPGPHEEIVKAVDELGATYPIALGDDALLTSLGIEVFPTTVYLNKRGDVSGTYAGLLLDPQLEIIHWLQ